MINGSLKIHVSSIGEAEKPTGVSPESAKILFKLQHIDKHYHLGTTEITALKNLSFTITQGEFLIVWGPSGSGKSTLLNLLATLDTPDHGELIFDGKNLHELNDQTLTELRQREISVIFQDFNLVPVLSALENVMLPLQVRGEKLPKTRQMAEQLLKEVGVGAQMNQRPDQLSGGQRQRVAIARALVTRPKVVIADEPTANLDSITTSKIIELMLKLNQLHGTTFVFSSHDPLLIDQAQFKIHLRDGQIVPDIADVKH